MIDVAKKYKTRNEASVRLISTDGYPSKPVVGFISDDPDPFSWDSEGFYYGNDCPDEWDLIEMGPFDDFEIDEPVFAVYEDGLEEKALFAGSRNGIPCVYFVGTSWLETTRIDVPAIRKLTSEEKKELNEYRLSLLS